MVFFQVVWVYWLRGDLLSLYFDLGRLTFVWNAERARIMKSQWFVRLLIWVLRLFLRHFLLGHFLKRIWFSEGVELRSQTCSLDDLACLVFLLRDLIGVLWLFFVWISVPDLVVCLLNLLRLPATAASRAQNSFWLPWTTCLGLLGHDFRLLFLLPRLTQLVPNQAVIQNTVLLLLYLYLRVHI